MHLRENNLNHLIRRFSGLSNHKFCLLALSVFFLIAYHTASVSGLESGPIPDQVQFNRDIRPILSENCFYCHGPDKSHREAELRLDTREGLLGNATKKGVVNAKSPEKSLLVKRLLEADPELHMPPPESGKKLDDRQVQLIRRWIEQGAEYEGHWAFLPINAQSVRRTVPEGVQDSEVIDTLVRASLKPSGLKPSQQADRVTLLRRLNFDLLGLPPQPRDVANFIADQSPDAYEKQVDRLMASPHFGERLAMFWLDLVRYADSVGYHGDQEVSVSPFRQYVIESFNDNKPFNQFTEEQLAGDLLANPTQEQKVAAAYNRLGMMSAEGGVQDKEYLAKYAAERVRNVSGTWLGVTLGCSECHDHKFDPFTTREFYQMEAFFADIKEKGLYSGSDFGSSMPVPTVDQQNDLRAINQKISEATALYEKNTPELSEAFAQWQSARPVWTTLTPASIKSEKGAKLELLADGSILASGENPATDTYLLDFENLPDSVTALRIDVLPHDSLPRKGPGRAGNGNFVLTELEWFRVPAEGPPESVVIDSAHATYEQTGAAGNNPYGKWAVAAAIDKDAKGITWGWAIMEKAGTPQSAVFVLNRESAAKPSPKWQLVLRQNLDNPGHNLGHFRISVSNHADPARDIQPQSPELDAILAVKPEARTLEQYKRLMDHFRQTAPQLEPVRKQLATLNQQKAELEKRITKTLVTVTVEPRMIRVLPRGNWMDDSGDVVKPAFPAVLQTSASATATDPSKPLNRLDLARWITDPKNPLTARVFVNRLWKVYFGEALSRKVDDLGSQGSPPTHPELLDFLALRFVENGWDVKRLIKSLVMSQTYQQSSVATDQLQSVDPFNMLIARQGRFRLDAELVRDNALAVSGLLVSKIGGPSVRPYQPPGYWSYLNFPTREWQNGQGESLYRRGLYTHWQRQYLHPSLLAFDAPNREECTAERARSNTPLQSLVLLNDPTYVESARAFAELIINQGGSTHRERLNYAYQRALSRDVSDSEFTVLESLLKAAKTEYQAHPDAAKKLLSVGSRPVDSRLDPIEIAAWTSVARAIFNLHETITRN